MKAVKNNNPKTNGQTKTQPAPKPSKKTPAKKPAPPAKKKAAKKAQRAELKSIFGQSVAAVARKLHAAGMKPTEVIRAIHAHEPKASEASVRGYCRTGQKAFEGAPVATLKKEQLASLKKAGAATVAA